MNLEPLARGDRLTADYLRRMINELRRVQPIAGPGIRCNQAPNGTNVSIDEEYLGRARPTIYEIGHDSDGNLVFVNCYLKKAGGEIVQGPAGTPEDFPGKCVALKISASEGAAGGAELAEYADESAMISASASAKIIPLYTLDADGKVLRDWRIIQALGDDGSVTLDEVSTDWNDEAEVQLRKFERNETETTTLAAVMNPADTTPSQYDVVVRDRTAGEVKYLTPGKASALITTDAKSIDFNQQNRLQFRKFDDVNQTTAANLGDLVDPFKTGDNQLEVVVRDKATGLVDYCPVSRMTKPTIGDIAGAAGLTTSVEIVTDVQYDISAHQLQKKTRQATFTNGVLTALGNESSWTLITNGQAIAHSKV